MFVGYMRMQCCSILMMGLRILFLHAQPYPQPQEQIHMCYLRVFSRISRVFIHISICTSLSKCHRKRLATSTTSINFETPASPLYITVTITQPFQKISGSIPALIMVQSSMSILQACSFHKFPQEILIVCHPTCNDILTFFQYLDIKASNDLSC